VQAEENPAKSMICNQNPGERQENPNPRSRVRGEATRHMHDASKAAI